MSILTITGSFKIALLAAQKRCQEVVEAFLRSGGRISGDVVTYRDLRLPRRLFTDGNLAGVGFLRALGDYGAQIDTETDVAMISLPNGLRFEARDSRFIDTLCMLVERFVDEEYAWLDVDGHIVIDIGANIADSVLYFAHRGAAYVYGYEPEAAAYEAATRNVILNKVDGVRVTRAAVVGRDQRGSEPSVTFSEVVGTAVREHPEIPIVCKIDCEGCEYDVLAADSLMDTDLRNVTQLMIEYHWRPPGPISEVLVKIGFKVDTATGPPGVGWIRAHRLAGAGARG